ncbi:hypothetical protein Cni_G23847 [Canna indica]|uniref:Galactose oxidase n=1 Tax=Canna indica TaxID=4628 RepID=A0AAQ3QJJ9_9LILI|nr:hypothetical protein Cni_G23847 [Canna indica]
MMTRTRTRSHAATFSFLRPLLLVLAVLSAPSHATTSTGTAGGSGGYWRLLRKSIGISAMHMQLLPDNTVIMFDRTDFGPSNVSLPFHRCSFGSSHLALARDCTAHSVLFDLPTTTVRPLTLLTNIWCSSGALLPNGSLLQTGGFGDGDRTVRLFSPSVRHSDWVESPSYLAVRRWYASNQLLPDGRVIVLGGRRQFSYEFVPSDSPSRRHVFQFPFLVETWDRDAENNLYPFLHLLPDGTLFVFANDRAVILDAAGNRVIRRLPFLPDGPRSYPSSGSSVLLPLRPGAAAEVLVCGGAPRGSYQAALNGTFLPALRTCARIKPADPNPIWFMEDMPLARVMGDMLLLPTCDVLIVNGAAAGTAGWDLARDPVTSPVLYRPDSPVGSRFDVLNQSETARMYHSTAVLDTYGRVLVGGSNPHNGYVFANVTFPTELSLEAFYPPYLSAGPRPRLLNAKAEVGYGEMVTVQFEAAGEYYSACSALNLEVVAIAPAFSSHALGMNQRVVVLPVMRAGWTPQQFVYEAVVVTPPSPEVAPPGYYLWFVVHGGVPSVGVWVRIA